MFKWNSLSDKIEQRRPIFYPKLLIFSGFLKVELINSINIYNINIDDYMVKPSNEFTKIIRIKPKTGLLSNLIIQLSAKS